MRERIMAILEDICGAEPGELEPDMELFEEGVLDSFGVISLFVDIEKKLGVRLEPTEIERERLSTPDKIVAEVMKKL